MFKFNKRKSPIEISNELVGFALDPKDIQLAVSELPSSVKADTSDVEYELRFLRIFAVDLGITLGFQKKLQEKEIISAGYFSVLNSVIQDFPKEIGTKFMEVLEKRFDNYVQIIKEPSQNDP